MNPVRFIPRTQHNVFLEFTKHFRITPMHPKVSLTLAKVSIPNSAVRKVLSKHGVPGRIKKKKAMENIDSLCQKKNPWMILRFLKELPMERWIHNRSLQTVEVSLCQPETKNCISKYSKYLVSIVKHGGGSFMVWRYDCCLRPGQLAFIEGGMNSALHQRTLQENLSFSRSQSASLSCNKINILNTMQENRRTNIVFLNKQANSSSKIHRNVMARPEIGSMVEKPQIFRAEAVCYIGMCQNSCTAMQETNHQLQAFGYR